ncbi:MAG: hypothetical protein NW203_09035 [Hyphomonadaceae bacterium]|nr:hypothetical protein [Hyphomonadaceae bacterium]
MHSEKPLSPEPLNAELELLTDDAPPTQGAAVWEDVSGGLHWRSPFNKGRRKEDRMPAEALDALSFGHSLLADSELIAPAPAAHALIDDAGGRFAIDPDTGVISLADPALARDEFGRIHKVRVRSGDYEATFHLRVAAPLPEVVMPNGADPFGMDPFAHDAILPDNQVFALAPPPPGPVKAWCELAAAHGAVAMRTPAREDAPFGAALGDDCAAYPSMRQPSHLVLDAPMLMPTPRNARWLDA